MKKILYYVNQFFGQVGGEEKADIAPTFVKESIGPALGFAQAVKGQAEVCGTMICGDNFFNEHQEEALEFLKKIVTEEKPDLVVAGPAFNAGRYGMACAGVVDFCLKHEIPVLTGMYKENPGVDQIAGKALIVETANSAAGMRKALPVLSKFALKMLSGEEIGKPQDEGYLPRGKRETVIVPERGSLRAVEMLIKRLNGEAFETELPMPVFDNVSPAEAIKDLSKACIALVTSGGIVPLGNPRHLQSASAQMWTKEDVSSLKQLTGSYMTVHGGYDPVYANAMPDRVAPLDILREFEEEGYIGHVYPYFYATTGTGTSVANARRFGQEIGAELKEAGVDGVLLTST